MNGDFSGPTPDQMGIGETQGLSVKMKQLLKLGEEYPQAYLIATDLPIRSGVGAESVFPEAEAWAKTEEGRRVLAELQELTTSHPALSKRWGKDSKIFGNEELRKRRGKG